MLNLHRIAKRLTGTLTFLVGIVVVIGLAYTIPEVGVALDKHGVMRGAIMAVFLMSGLTISLKHLGDDAVRWKCHLFIQSVSFGIIPLSLYFTSGWLPEGPMKYGVYLVAAVPTTIASCVIYTTAAGGRTPSAMINAVGGNLLGIVLSPLLLALMIGHSAEPGAVSAGKAVLDLCKVVLFPFLAGRLLGAVLPRLIGIIKPVQSRAAQLFVLLVIFCGFSKSAASSALVPANAWLCFAYLAVAHMILVAAAILGTRFLRFSREESIAAVFCSTQKTLAMSAPLAASFFGDDVGLVLMPIIFYHLFQLTFGSILIPLLGPRETTTSK